jgi:hypothetical protein
VDAAQETGRLLGGKYCLPGTPSVGLKERGARGNAGKLMHMSKAQCHALGGYKAAGRNSLKALDECSC